MDPRTAEVDGRAGEIHRVRAAADPITTLDDDDIDAAQVQRAGGNESGDPRPDHNDPFDASVDRGTRVLGVLDADARAGRVGWHALA